MFQIVYLSYIKGKVSYLKIVRVKDSSSNISDDSINNATGVSGAKESEMYSTLKQVPKNPSHFVALCMRLLRDDPNIANSPDVYVKKLQEIKGRAIFGCAYGYFWSTTDRYCCKEFFATKKECVTAADR